MQRSVAPRADLVHPSTTHRRPPPCALQWAVLPCALLLQPGWLQRRPPPCEMQKQVLPCAPLLQPDVMQKPVMALSLKAAGARRLRVRLPLPGPATPCCGPGEADMDTRHSAPLVTSWEDGRTMKGGGSVKPPPKPWQVLGGGHGTSCMRAGGAADDAATMLPPPPGCVVAPDDDVAVELATEASCAKRSILGVTATVFFVLLGIVGVQLYERYYLQL
jgi:hypothetical protein